MKVSDYGLEQLKFSEGSKNKPYKDSVGLWTIGIGHLLSRDELMRGKVYIQIHNTWADYRGKNGLNDEDVLNLFRTDIKWVENTINFYIDEKLNLQQHQFDALCNLTYNIGTTAFLHSTLRKKINAADFAAVPQQIRRWKYAGGRVVKGLVLRREREVNIWLGTNYPQTAENTPT